MTWCSRSLCWTGSARRSPRSWRRARASGRWSSWELRSSTATGSTTAPSRSRTAWCSVSHRSPTCRPTGSSTSAGGTAQATTAAATHHRRRSGRPLRPRPPLRRDRRARPGRPRRGMRGHVGAGPAERRGCIGRRHGAAQPLGQPDHGGTRRGPAAAGALGEPAVPGCLRVRRRRRGRVEHRPLLGRPDDDLRGGRAARRDRAVPRRPPAIRRRRRPRPPPLRADPDGDLRRQPQDAGLARRGVPHHPVHRRPSDRRHRSATQGRPVPVRAGRPRAARARLLRGLQHPGLRARAAAARDRPPQGGDRRLGRPRLHPRPHRGGARDGPAGPTPHRHPRLHAARVRHRREDQGQRVAARRGARHQHGGDRHHARPPSRCSATSTTRSPRESRSTT